MTIPTTSDRVHRTALRELGLIPPSALASYEVRLGLFSAVVPRESAIYGEFIHLKQASPTVDACEILLHGSTLYLVGNTPRGVLHAVYLLRELLAGGAQLSDGFHHPASFQFGQRIFHARFQPWPATRSDVRHISHLGATHCLVCHDWDNSRRSLQGYVTSPIFPAAVDPAEVAANHTGLRRLLDDCTDHGLGAMLWLTELPCQGGPWMPAADREAFFNRYPKEVLSDSGTYEGMVLCFSHPQVQAYYRDLLQRFFADFPEVETIFLFGSDSGGEFCDPDKCPRCRGLSRIAQRDRLVCFLVEEGQRHRPGLRVLTTGWGWEGEPDFLARQAALPSSSGLYLAAQKDGWQCERQAHDFLRAARKTCRTHGQTFIGYDNFHWGDDTVHGINDIQDFPLGIAAKLRRWHSLGADGVFDHWGHRPEDSWCNSVALREFFLNPLAEPEPVCRTIAHRQFGPRAGELVFRAWVALEGAHQHLSPACTWSPLQWPGWYGSRQTPPLPGHFPSEALRKHQLPPRREGNQFYNPPDLASSLQCVADAWHRAYPRYEEAARLLIEAQAAVGDDATPLFYHFWWDGPQPTPTRREHLRRQQLYVESMALTGCEIGLQFGLHALWETSQNDPARFRSRATPLLRQDAAACRAAAAYFRTVGKPLKWPEQYETKAALIEAYLRGG